MMLDPSNIAAGFGIPGFVAAFESSDLAATWNGEWLLHYSTLQVC